MDDAADSWFSTLPAAKQNNWDQHEEAFNEQFVEFEPAMVTESKYLSRMWKGVESPLARKLGRTDKQLMLKFAQGLPRDYQDFILSTDNHSLATYNSRARLHHARRIVDPSPQNYFGQNHAVALVHELKESLNGFNLHVNAVGWSRGRSSQRDDRRYDRPVSRDNYRERHHTTSHDRFRNQSNRSLSHDRYQRRRDESAGRPSSRDKEDRRHRLIDLNIKARTWVL